MGQLLQSYLPLVIFIGIAFVISAAILLAPFVIAVSKPDPEKVSAYECGFDAFDDARMKFDVRWRSRFCFPGPWPSRISGPSASGR